MDSEMIQGETYNSATVTLDLGQLDKTDYILILLNKDGDVLFQNQQAQAVLPKNIKFLSLLDLDKKSLFSDGAPVHPQIITTIPQQSNKVLRIYWTSLRTREQHILFIGHVYHENTENSEAMNEVLLMNIINNLPHSIFWKDRESKFLGCNKIFATTAGYNDPDEIIGRTDYDLPWKKYAEKYIADDKEVMEEQIPKLIYEETNIQADGSEKTVLVTKIPMQTKSKEIIGILGIFTDITSLKELEKRKQQNKFDKEVIAKLEIMAGSLAHELRTPITAIRTGLTGLQKFLPQLIEGYNEARKLKLVKPIRTVHFNTITSITRNLLNEALSCDRIIDIQLKNISINNINSEDFLYCSMDDILTTALDSYPASTHEKSLIHYDNKNNFIFYGSDILTKHIIWNLLKNSFYYIKSVGRGEIYIWFDHDHQYNYLHFKDTAKGVPESLKDKIFERFYTSSGQGSGTGIGLSFIKLVMQAYQGDITCESIENQFIEFILRFPKI